MSERGLSERGGRASFVPHWMKVVFQPRWIALAILVLGFTGLCWSVLAPWQLGKNTDTSRRNDQISEAVKAPPVPVAQLLGGKSDVPSDAEWREVTVTGHYVPDKQALVRLRYNNGTPSYEVVVPFAAENGTTYLVDRGYIPAPKGGGSVPDFAAPPTGTVTVVARVHKSEASDPTRGPRREAGYLQVFSIDSAEIGKATSVALAPGYLALIDGQPGVLSAQELPMLDSGPYLSYGLQWLAFGIMAPLGLGYFIYAELRRRREEKAAMEAAEAAARAEVEGTVGPGAEGVVEADGTVEARGVGGQESPSTPEPDPEAEAERAEAARAAKLADRYGRRG